MLTYGAPGAASPSANAPARSGRLARLAAGAPKPEGPVCLLPLWPLFKPGPSKPKLANTHATKKVSDNGL